MLLTQLEYFVAVAREQHFGRAAASCYVSPSALSESIRKLEIELGLPLVRRGRTFEGLTPAGELALVWARRVLADDRALRDELANARDRLAAEVRFGVIPSAVTHAATLVTALTDAHPFISARMRTGLTTEEIVTGLRRYELDAGLIHPFLENSDDIALTPLYDEAMVIAGSSSLIPPDRRDLTGRELVALPHGLLEPHMRARQLLDAAFEGEGLTLAPRIETDSIEALLALARSGRWAVVIPRSAVALGAVPEDTRIVGLVEPVVTLPIALAQLADEPSSPVAVAIDLAAAQFRASA